MHMLPVDHKRPEKLQPEPKCIHPHGHNPRRGQSHAPRGNAVILAWNAKAAAPSKLTCRE